MIDPARIERILAKFNVRCLSLRIKADPFQEEYFVVTCHFMDLQNANPYVVAEDLGRRLGCKFAFKEENQILLKEIDQ